MNDVIPITKLKDKNMKRFIALGWTILEAKAVYYNYVEGVDPRSDDWYDKIEDEYKALAKQLRMDPTASENVGFPMDTPSGKLVLGRIGKGKFKYTIDKWEGTSK